MNLMIPPKKISQETRRKAELQYAEIVGRLYACEFLENGTEEIEDYRVVYGWGLLAQETLIRTAEASLKLLLELYTGSHPPRTHSLQDLWQRIHKNVQKEVEEQRGEKLSFSAYDNASFQDVRYFADRRGSGQIVSFEVRRLYLDALAVTDVAKNWLGEITIWPWSGVLDKDLAGYNVSPIKDGKFEVWIDNPIEPLDWGGAIIEAKGNGYVWTLYFGFTDKAGIKRSCQLPSLHYMHLWTIKELIAPTVSESIAQIQRAYSEPCVPLVKAMEDARI